MWRSEASGKSVEHLQLFHSPSFNACAFLSLSAKAEIQKKHPSKNCTSNSWIFKGLQVRPVDFWNCQPFWLVNCRCLGFSVERWSVGTGSYCWWLNHHPVLSQIGSSSHQIKAKRCKKYIFNCGKFLKRRPCFLMSAPKWELLLELDPLPVLAISSVPNLSVPRLEVWFLFRLCSWKVVESWRKCYQWQEEVQKSTHTLWTCLSNCFNT